MANLTDQAFHFRSCSMPSTSHPSMQRVKGELHNLKTCQASSSRTAQTICIGLRSVGDLYESVEELLRLPSNQQSFHPSQRKSVEQQLDESLKLLDLIGGVRDSIVAMREHIQDLLSAIRRKGNTVTDSRNKTRKAIKDCLRSIKRMGAKHLSCSTTTDGDLLVEALIEARQSTISLLQSVLSFLSKPKQKANRWFTISKAISKRKVGSEEELEGIIEEESADMCLQASYDCLASTAVNDDASRVLKAQNHSVSLEVGLESIDLALDFLFKRLIQNRVALLNSLSL